MASVPEYNLFMEPTDLNWFRHHTGSDRCLPAKAQIAGTVYEAWIGYRGRYSRRFAKASYDLWFAHPGPRGRRTLHLNAAYADPSLCRGRLAHETFANLQVPTPRAWHAWVTMNAEPLGLYTVIEALDADWLGSPPNPGAAIYYGVGGEGNLGLINPKTGKPKQHLASGYEKCYPWDEDFSALVALIYRITLPENDEFETVIDRVVDVEQYLRWLIGIVFMSHTDGLVHNYALFKRDDTRWQISPWDCDGTWGRCPDGSRLSAQYMPLTAGGENYLAARLLTSPRWRQRYFELWDELLPGPLRPETIDERLNAIYQEIRTAAIRDNFKKYKSSTFRNERSHIRQYVSDRTAFLRQELTRWRATIA